MPLKTTKQPKKLKKPAGAAGATASAAAAAGEPLSEERVHSDDDDDESLPDVLALRNTIKHPSLIDAFERLMQNGTYKQSGVIGVAFQIYAVVLRKMLERAMDSKQQLAEMMAKYNDMSSFLTECDRIGLVEETAQFASSRGPDLARRLGHVNLLCVPRTTETRATTLFNEVRETLEKLCDEPANDAVRGYLVLLAPEIWTDKEFDILARGAPAPPRVRAHGMGKQIVRVGTMPATELPGDIVLEITATDVNLFIPALYSDVKRRTKKPGASFRLSFVKTRLIFEQISQLTALQGLLDQAVAQLDATSPLVDRARAADGSMPMLGVLVATDAFLLLTVLAVFVTAAPLDLEWDDPSHKVDAGDARTQFVTFATLALHCTPLQIYSIIDTVTELAPRLICSDMIKSDIFESRDSMVGLQLAFSTVAFYLAVQQVSTYFSELAGNTPHSQRLLPLALLAKLPINAMDVFGTANQPTNLPPHPDFKAMGPGYVMMTDMLLFAFAVKDDYPAALIFAVRRMVPWYANEMMVPTNINPRIVVGLTEEVFEQDPPLATVALSAWFSMLAAPTYYRNKPSSTSPIRGMFEAHRADMNGLFDGSSGVFARICRSPLSIDGLAFVSHAAANLALITDDDRASAFGSALLCSFVSKYVDDKGNLNRLVWEDEQLTKKRKRGAGAGDDDDDDDDGRLTVKTSATARTRRNVKQRKRASAADDDDDGRLTVKTSATTRTVKRARVVDDDDDDRPAKRARAADDNDDEEKDMSETEKMIERMIQKSLAKILAKQN